MTDPHLPHALRILARDLHCEDGIATQCIREAADEIDLLRCAITRLAQQEATLSVCDGAVTVTMDATLTDAEREAVVRAWHGLLKLVALEKQLADVHLADARTINALLARTKNG